MGPREDRLPGWSELPEEHVDLPEHQLRRSGLRIKRPVEPEGEDVVEAPEEQPKTEDSSKRR